MIHQILAKSQVAAVVPLAAVGEVKFIACFMGAVCMATPPPIEACGPTVPSQKLELTAAVVAPAKPLVLPEDAPAAYTLIKTPVELPTKPPELFAEPSTAPRA